MTQIEMAETPILLGRDAEGVKGFPRWVILHLTFEIRYWFGIRYSDLVAASAALGGHMLPRGGEMARQATQQGGDSGPFFHSDCSSVPRKDWT